jgi:diacylglycerol kinase (ATP)
MRWIRGRLKYNLAILLELPIFRPRQYHFQIDGETFEIDAMLIAIANGQSYGGGMNVCPDAEIDDGVFDVMILEPVSKFEFLRVFPKVFKGQHVTHPRVRMLRGKRIKVEAKAIAYSDGERMGPLPILAEIVPNALRIWRQR